MADMSEGTSQSPIEAPRIIVVPRGQVVVRPGEVDRTRELVRQLAWFMDNAFEIPGTRYRIGFDALIGLIPVIGDFIGMLIGSYIVLVAARLGVPRTVQLRMLVNLGIDMVLGSIPIVGDMLDAAWKANAMNARLLERALDDPKAAGRSSFWALLGLFTLLLVLTAGAIALMVWLVHLLIQAVR
jgi:Domain of unknown function (DUF4112)